MAEADGVALYSSRFCDDSQALDVVDTTLWGVLDLVHVEVEKKRMERLAVPLATDVAMIKLRRLMAWAVLDHDGAVEEGSNFEHLTPDNEPKVLIVDPWARGMIPTKTVKPEGAEAYRTLGGDMVSGNQSPRSATGTSRSGTSYTGTSRSGTSRGTHTHRSGTSQMSSRGGHGEFKDDDEDDPTGQIFDLEDEFDNMAANANLMSLEQLLKKQAKQEVVDGKETVQKSEYELLQEGIENQVKELKGKKYTIDRDGSVIPLAPVKPGALPPYQVNPDTKVGNYKEKASRGGSRKNTATGTAGGTAAGAGPATADSLVAEPGTAADNGGKKKRTIRVAGGRPVDEYTFLPSYTLADTLSGTADQVAPTAGVTVTVNETARQGANVPSIPGKMSRREYAARNASGAGAAAALAENSLEEGSSLLLQTGELAFNDSQVPASMQGGGAAVPNMRSEVQYKVPDVDVMAGGRRITREAPASPTAREADQEDGLGPMSNAGGGGDISLAHLPGPKNPNVRLFSHDTSLTGTPKDRDLPKNMKKPSERSHSVAPPPGTVSMFDSPDKFAMARMAQGLPPYASSSPAGGALSPTGSTADAVSVGSHANKSKSKVGVLRTKGGSIKNEKPHMVAQYL